MTWAAVKKTLTTPPLPRPPPPKHPTFTRDFFSTKSFGPGHLVGAGILVFGVVGLTKYFIKRGREQAEQNLAQQRQQQPQQLQRPVAPAPDEARLAEAENARGEYGNKP